MSGSSFYCIIHEGRCGSTVLASLLAQHPAIVHFNEILTRGVWISREFVGSESEKRRDALALKLPDLCGFVREVASTNKAGGKPDRVFTGFEIKMNQLPSHHLDCDLPALADTLAAGLGDVRFIFLTRRNILRRHVSILRCLFNDVTHSKDRELANVNFDKVIVAGDTMRDWSYDFTRLHPDLPALLEASEARRREVRGFAETRGDLYLEYEDFERDPMIGAQRVFRHLGLPPVAAESPLLRTGDKPLPELIGNFAEVSAALRGTRWEAMLE